MKAIVTGANGFVGSHLVERLVKEGLHVVCLVRPTGDLRWIRGLPVEICADGMDSVEGLAKVAAGQTYFIGSGTYTMTELAAAMSPAVGRRLRLLHVPKPLAVLAGELGQLKWALTGKPQIVSRRKIRDLLQPRWTCSWDKAGVELDYREGVTLAEGMRKTALWYAAQGWIRPLKPSDRS